jgi:hypothetical protein
LSFGESGFGFASARGLLVGGEQDAFFLVRAFRRLRAVLFMLRAQRDQQRGDPEPTGD